MNRSLCGFVAAIALLMGTGAYSQAAIFDPADVAWSYDFKAYNPNMPLPTPPGQPQNYAPLTSVPSDVDPSHKVIFFDEPVRSYKDESSILATNLRIATDASVTAANPDRITGANGNYLLRMTLTDQESGQSKVLDFTGRLSGKFSSENSAVDNIFTSPTVYTATLGKVKYTVTLNNYSRPTIPSAVGNGAIDGYVTLAAADDPHQGVPEPTALLLGGLGMTFLGGVAWRKRRQARLASRS